MTEPNAQSFEPNAQPASQAWSVLSESLLEETMARLENAAKAGDERAFLLALKEIEYEELSVADFIRIIRGALKAGAYKAAYEVSARGATLYPADSELQKHARVLAPPKLISSSLPPDPDVEANHNWMKRHGKEFRGQWVAVRKGQLLGASATLDDLVGQLDDRRDTLITIAY
jgi:hypothetical protein